MHDLPPQGPIDSVFLPRLVAGLHIREFEGTLRLALPDAVRVLYFKKGEIASAASNAETDRLANILIRDGRLTSEQLDLARSRLQPAASLGKTLIEMGFLTPTELLQGARRQVQVIVGSCFTARTGTYELVPGPLPAEVTSLGVNTRRLLFDCLMDTGDRDTIIREIGSMEVVYRPTGRLDYLLASLKLDFETDRIARLLNGEASLRDLSSRTSRDDLTVSKVVLALDLLDGAERVAPLDVGVAPAGRGRAIPIFVESEEARPAPAAMDSVDAMGRHLIEDAIELEAPGIVAAAVEVRDPAPPAPTAIAIDEEADPGSPAVASPHGTDAPTPAFALEEPAAAEPPPIPQNELPAFAQSPAEMTGRPPAGDDGDHEPHWEIDPVTGERVHVGPIEMTFDGRIAPGSGPPGNLTRILLGAGAVTLVVGGALGYVILRRGAGAPSTVPPPVATASAPSTPSAAEPNPGPVIPPSGKAAPGGTLSATAAAGLAAARSSPPPADVLPDAAARAPEDRTAGRPAPLPPEEVRPAPPAAPTVRTTAKPVPTEHPTPVLQQPAAPAGEAEGLAADPDFATAQGQIDQGDPAGAARQFESWIVAQNPDRFTLQIMIACQDDTVKAARRRAGAGGSLFILPYSLNGRPCYRVCWGVYESAESARAAAPAVPSALAGSSPPLVVPLSHLRSSG
jgi:septal ring-binding cell division protein DamX